MGLAIDRHSIFSHGHLYVALSRVRNLKDIIVLSESVEVPNIVYKEVLDPVEIPLHQQQPQRQVPSTQGGGVKQWRSPTRLSSRSPSPTARSPSPIQSPDRPPTAQAPFAIPVGLPNIGNTCYLNSSLQLLRSQPEMSTFFIGHLQDFRFVDLSEQTRAFKRKHKVLLEFAILMDAMERASRGSSIDINPRHFKNACGLVNDNFAGNREEDAEEFLHWILNLLDEQCDAIHISSPIKRIFSGDYQRTVICGECGQPSASALEPFLIHSVDLTEDGVTLEEVDRNFELVEQMDTEWEECPHCKAKRVKANKFVEVAVYPPSLIYQLKRFDYDQRTDTATKREHSIDFPMYVNSSPYIQSIS